jgi:hypothetical protein
LKTKLQEEKTSTQEKMTKQSVLIDPYFNIGASKSNKADKPKKEIVIQDITYVTEENELALKIAFKLLPSKVSFSKVTIDLYFEEQLLNSTTLGIPQGLLTTDSFEFPHILDMEGIAQGRYPIRVEMFEPWSTGEKLNYTFKEVTISYAPQTRKSRYVKIPTVKSVAGIDLLIVSSSTKALYREIEEDKKRESNSSQDKW